MPLTSCHCAFLIAIDLALAPLTSGTQGQGQSSQASSTADVAAARGVQCPTDFEAVFDPAAKVLRCRREVVAWVVTRCPEKDFASYSARQGPDACGPTEIPGVGTPPGATGFKPVACAAPGYAVIVDRTGPRDRCERIERSFALPRPVP
jgi:hypothetical protein